MHPGSLVPVMPFWGLDPAQIDRRWVEAGYGLEAILFNGAELEELPRLADTLAGLPSELPLTLHFPMSQANYLVDDRVRDRLFGFIDLAVQRGARGVVIHSNYLIRVEDLAATDIPALRRRFLRFFGDMDDRLEGSGLWLGVENMPLVGDLGEDVDCMFVYPQDFEGFEYRNVGIVLDVAHWIGTLESVAEAESRDVPKAFLPPLRHCQPLDCLELGSRIRHLHLSAVEGVALPPRLSIAHAGGVPPATTDDDPYVQIVRGIPTPLTSVSLEIAEADYRQRTSIWEALDWLRAVGVLADEAELS
jgi:hypothetical protein